MYGEYYPGRAMNPLGCYVDYWYPYQPEQDWYQWNHESPEQKIARLERELRELRKRIEQQEILKGSRPYPPPLTWCTPIGTGGKVTVTLTTNTTAE